MHEFAVTIGVGDPGLGPGVADAHADAVQPLPEAAALDAARARSTTCIERVLRRVAEQLRLDAAADDPVQGHRRWWSRSLLLAGTVYLFRIVPKGFIPSVDTGQMSGRSKPSRASASTKPVEHSLRGDRHPRERSERRRVHREHRRDGRRPARTSTSSRATERTADRRPDHRGAAAEAGAVPGVRVFLTNPPRDPHRRHARRAASTSSRCRIRTPRSCIEFAPQFEAALRNVAGLQDVTSDLQVAQPAADGRSRSRADRRARAHRRPGADRRCTRPTARARSRRSTRPTTSTR